MDFQLTLTKFNIRIASIFNEYDWVTSVARDIDLKNEIDLGLKFHKMMLVLRESFKFAGISSNNIYWDLTSEPVRMITIPAASEDRYITLLNPEILKMDGDAYSNIESCGSVPDNNSYIVKRKPYVLIGGYDLDEGYVELAYGGKDDCKHDEAVFALYQPQAWIIQHEMDHLNGVTIKDKGILFDSDSLMS